METKTPVFISSEKSMETKTPVFISSEKSMETKTPVYVFLTFGFAQESSER